MRRGARAQCPMIIDTADTADTDTADTVDADAGTRMQPMQPMPPTTHTHAYEKITSKGKAVKVFSYRRTRYGETHFIFDLPPSPIDQ